jgi:hypothetical protein
MLSCQFFAKLEASWEDEDLTSITSPSPSETVPILLPKGEDSNLNVLDQTLVDVLSFQYPMNEPLKQRFLQSLGDKRGIFLIKISMPPRYYDRIPGIRVDPDLI